MQAIAATIRRPIIAGLARACSQDIERAWQALKGAARPRIHVFLATSDIHLQYKLRISRQQCLDQARDSVRLAKSLCADVEFSPEDATRTDHEFLYQVLATVVEAGATTLNIPDTVGYSMPEEFGELIRSIRQRVPDNVVISAHCHNDLGLAVGNSWPPLPRARAGGVHDQRHRRARGQCLAEEIDDGYAGASGPGIPTKPALLRNSSSRRGQLLKRVDRFDSASQQSHN